MNLKIALLILSGPVIVNIILSIPSLGLAASNEDVWLSFFGNYIGGIMGGIVAYLIARIQIVEQREQFKQQLQISNKKQKEREELGVKIITDFIYPEIETNIEKLLKTNGLMASLIKASSGELTSYGYTIEKINLEFDVYNETKFEIIKYENNLVKGVLDIYNVFKELSKYSAVDKISKDRLGFIIEQLNYWEAYFNY